MNTQCLLQICTQENPQWVTVQCKGMFVEGFLFCFYKTPFVRCGNYKHRFKPTLQTSPIISRLLQIFILPVI